MARPRFVIQPLRRSLNVTLFVSMPQENMQMCRHMSEERDCSQNMNYVYIPRVEHVRLDCVGSIYIGLISPPVKLTSPAQTST